VLHVPDYKAGVGRYFARLLDDLGFRTTLTIQPGASYDIYSPHTRATAGMAASGADYLAPSTFIEPIFACTPGSGDAPNPSHLCDRTLHRLIDRAVRTPPADAAGAWAAADRRVVDLAQVVPLTNRRSVVLVSKRVGNVKTHGQWFTLLDQLWVH
jgi:hypothetical protein